MADDDTVTPEEYGGWIKAEDALGMFGKRPARATMRAIADRLVSGLLRSAARHWIYRGKKRVEFAVIPDMAWQWWAYESDPQFWDAGDTMVPVDHVDGFIPSNWDYHLYGVRFDPEGLREMGAVGLPDGEAKRAAAGAETTENPKPVPAADLERWAQIALAVHGESLTEAFALRSAKAMFPDHAVSRDRVRALLPARKPGRPVTRDKIRE